MTVVAFPLVRPYAETVTYCRNDAIEALHAAYDEVECLHYVVSVDDEPRISDALDKITRAINAIKVANRLA
jgi:hypothetical protein